MLNPLLALTFVRLQLAVGARLGTVEGFEVFLTLLSATILAVVFLGYLVLFARAYRLQAVRSAIRGPLASKVNKVSWPVDFLLISLIVGFGCFGVGGGDWASLGLHDLQWLSLNGLAYVAAILLATCLIRGIAYVISRRACHALSFRAQLLQVIGFTIVIIGTLSSGILKWLFLITGFLLQLYGIKEWLRVEAISKRNASGVAHDSRSVDI